MEPWVYIMYCSLRWYRDSCWYYFSLYQELQYPRSQLYLSSTQKWTKLISVSSCVVLSLRIRLDWQVLLPQQAVPWSEEHSRLAGDSLLLKLTDLIRYNCLFIACLWRTLLHMFSYLILLFYTSTVTGTFYVSNLVCIHSLYVHCTCFKFAERLHLSSHDMRQLY